MQNSMENMHTEVGFFHRHREKLGGEGGGGWGVGRLIPFGSGLTYFTISISRKCTVYPPPPSLLFVPMKLPNHRVM